MKLTIALTTLLVLLCFAGKSFSQETNETEESAFYYGFDAGFSNKYMWRGIEYNNGLVFQPDVYFGYNDLCLTLWSNVTVWDIDGLVNNELDFTLSYYKTIFDIDLEASINYYNYFGYTEYNTSEAIMNLSYPIGGFSVFNSFSVDVLEYAGAIFNETGISYDRELNDQLNLNGTILTGYASGKFNEGYLEVNKSAFNYMGIGAMLTYTFKNDFALDAHFQFNRALDEDIAYVLGDNNSYFEIIFRKEF